MLNFGPYYAANVPHVGQIDHHLDHLDSSLSLLYVVQDLYGTNPAQETCLS